MPPHEGMKKWFEYITEISSNIRSLYDEYKKTHKGHEPRYAECQVRWLDNDESMPVWIKMNTRIGKNDDKIFFNCNGIDDLLRLLEKGAEDFVLVDVFSFTGKIY